jgi:threonine dehydrogenase-like Zn-dependent dehydrogenase
MLNDGAAKVIATEGNIALGTDTTGNYVATITGSTGIDSSAATSGEGTTHSLTLDLNELTAATGIVSLAGVGASSATKKFTMATVVAEMLSDVSASTTVGDDTETVFYIDHGLSSNKVIVQLYDATGNTVIADVRRGVSDASNTASTDHIKVSFNAAPASDEQITVLIHKIA